MTIKKLLSVLLFCCFCFFALLGQSRGEMVDLLTKLKLAKHDTIRMDIHIQIADIFINNDAEADKGINHARLALILAENYEDRHRSILAYNQLLKGYFNLKYDLKKATDLLNEAKLIDTTGIPISSQAMLFGHEGKIFSALNDFEKSQNAFFTQLNIYEKLNDVKGIAQVNFDIGNLFFNQNDFSQSLQYFNKALEGYNLLESKRGKLKTLNAIGQVYGQLKDYTKNLSYSSEALLLAQMLDDKLELARVNSNIGFAYQHLDRPLDALNHYLETLKIGKELDNNRMITEASTEIANIYHVLCNEISAYDYYQKALFSLESTDSKLIEKNVFESIFQFHEDYGRDSAAFFYLKKINVLKDDLYNEERSTQLIANQIRYETEKREKEVKLLRAKEIENNLTIKQQQLQNYILWFFILLVIIVAVLLYKAFRRKKAYNDLLKEEVAKRTHELKESNEELQYFNKQLERSNNELERFAYIASHDLKSPLRNVISFLSLIKRRLGKSIDENIQEYLRFASDNAHQMHNLIQDVLEFSRVETQEVSTTEVDLNESLMLVLQNLQDSMETKRAVVFAQELPKIEANSVHVMQLFQNLIGNGIKYNKNKNPRVIVGHKMDNSSHVFSVIDNGIGISKDYYDQIFEMFKRLHTREEYQGTGIGLALCKKIVNNLGGEIWLESREGRGTTFYFSVPKISKSANRFFVKNKEVAMAN